MIAMSVAEVAQAVDGRLHEMDVRSATRMVTGPVEFDSRRMTKGGLFVAFSGEHADGHDFAGAAMAAGAVASLATRPVAGPAIIVPDALAALARLASEVL